MSIKTVIGLGFGDEGKGRIVSSLAHQAEASLVIRYSGGQQAAHHVMKKEGSDHVFSGFGSNSFEENAVTLWDESCVFYPRAFLNEYDILNKKGLTPTIKIHKKCPLITPYDIAYNRIRNNKLRHGSVGVGIGTTIGREEDGIHFLIEDLQYPSVIKHKLKMIKIYYGDKGKSENIITSVKDGDLFYQETNINIIREYLEECQEFLNLHNNKNNGITIIDEAGRYALLSKVSRNPATEEESDIDLIYESSQGILLDPEVGFFPHVTRGIILPKIPYHDISGHFDEELKEVENWLVHRSYTTRHGNGPMSHEDKNFPDNPNELNTTSEHQGHFRKGLLDLDLLQYAIDKTIEHTHGKNYLCLTCMDILSEKPQLIMKGDTYNFKNKKHFLGFIEAHIKNIDKIFYTDTPYAEDYPKIFTN